MYARNPVPVVPAYGVFYFCEYIYVRENPLQGSSSHHASSREPCDATFTARLYDIRSLAIKRNRASVRVIARSGKSNRAGARVIARSGKNNRASARVIARSGKKL